VPLTSSPDFKCWKYVLKAILSVVWLATTLTVAFLFLFGPLVEPNQYDWRRIGYGVLMMAKQAMLDYECVGSRVWLIVVQIVVPNAMILTKVLTN